MTHATPDLLVGVLGGVGCVHGGVDKRFKDTSLLQRLVMVAEEERTMEERGLSGGGEFVFYSRQRGTASPAKGGKFV